MTEKEPQTTFEQFKHGVSRLSDAPRRLWLRVVLWIEKGNLIPGILLVSVPHYVAALSKYDLWYVATALGVLIDIGQYRTIKAFMSQSERKQAKSPDSSIGILSSIQLSIGSFIEFFKSAFWMIVMSGLALLFHFEFYSITATPSMALIYASAIPLMIFALSYLSKRENLAAKASRALGDRDPEKVDTKPVESETRPPEPKVSVKPTSITYDEYVALNKSRNGEGPISAIELKKQYGLANTTAYRWLLRYERENPKNKVSE